VRIGEVNKVKRISVVVLAVSLLMLFGALTPAFAKNFNYPEGQDIVYSSGGEGYVATPAGYFGPVTSMKIRAVNVEIGTHGFGDNIEIDFLFPLPTGPIYLPIAFFTTNPNPDVIDWLKIVLSGFPAALLPNNIRYVSDDVLIVNRHGNSITVELTAPQTILMMPGPVSVVVPAFTVELNKVGGSVHQDKTVVLTGYPGASGWTGYTEDMGFNAEGAFTCPAWSYDSEPMTDCFITMHGITIYTPPASP
jgi:hypothetical protein